MTRASLIALGLLLLVGCAKPTTAAPKCTEPELQDRYVKACVTESSPEFCRCTWTEFAARLTCDEMRADGIPTTTRALGFGACRSALADGSAAP